MGGTFCPLNMVSVGLSLSSTSSFPNAVVEREANSSTLSAEGNESHMMSLLWIVIHGKRSIKKKYGAVCL